MKKSLHRLLVISVTILSLSKLYAVPATPTPITILQADGTEITFRLRGDEFFNYKTTLDGYTLIPDEKGIMTYAQSDTKGRLYSSRIKANNVDKRNLTEKFFVQGLKRNISYTKQNIASRVKRLASSSSASSSKKSYPLIGSPKSLVILVYFSDNNFVVSNTKTAFTNLLNEAGYSANGGTGSAADYFKDNSMGNFAPQFDVVGPYKLSQKMTYYGANDSSDEDKNPRQMVIDACAAADNDVNFTQYDTDGDGIVDNVFIYYAGYNEAEGAPANTIWPHRWTLANYSTKFDGVSIFDYACTSELRGTTGSNMCGVGTFCHEFGHVLGLPDYYTKATHQTLSYWNIMDAGPYLNLGRTPPSYSAFDRFYLNWLVPTEIKTSGEYTLENLATSNKADIFTQYGNHNLDGSNPSPVEFFTLENRQNTGWDSYLPGHGMLVSHIYYNASDWDDNGPNNNALAMGYDIVEADGIASDITLSGDPFPGTQNVKSYTPLLRDKTDIHKPITQIIEANGIIQFHFATNIVLTESLHSFKTVQGTPSPVQTVTASGRKLKGNIDISFTIGSHFEMKNEADPETAWGKTITLVPGTDSIVNNTNIQIRYNPTEPSYTATHDDKLVLKSGVNDYAGALLSGQSSRKVYVIPPIATQSTDVTFSSFVANWNVVSDSIGKPAPGYYLTVYSLSNENSSITEGFDNGITPPTKWIITPVNVSNSTIYSGLAVPSLQFANNGEKVETEKYMIPVTKLSFYIRSMGGANGGFLIEAQNEQNKWKKIDSIPVNNSLSEKNKTYTFLETDNYVQFRFTYIKGTGSVTFDDVNLNFSKKISYLENEKWLTTNYSSIKNLAPLSEYIFKVRASDKNTMWDYENITDYSNAISTYTLKYPLEKSLLAVQQIEGKINVFLPSLDTVIYVYTLSGKCMRVVTPSSNITEIADLPRGQTYILKASNRTVKITLY